MEWFIYALRRYSNFTGRSRRREFWMYTLFYILLSIGATFLDNLFGFISLGDTYGPISSLYAVIMLLPSIAVAIRRLHDIGKSGWTLLLGLIPVIGTIWLLIYFLREGTYGPNKYGPSPKEEIYEEL